MKHGPRSFSKNFGWGTNGLSKLHAVIRAGFANRLTSVEREIFVARSGLNTDQVLIPVNFFLHNRETRISVDELVVGALNHPHSPGFDRLGLFALHLNRVGRARGEDERPAMWANEFVRDVLWVDEGWDLSALESDTLDAFLSDRLDATPGVRVKCRNNYRYLFKQCGLTNDSKCATNIDAEQWIAPALFLAWDRHVLDGGTSDLPSLIGLVRSEELHKLLGVSKSFAISRAADLAEIYAEIGGASRPHGFSDGGLIPFDSPQFSDPQLSSIESARVVIQDGFDSSIERRIVQKLERPRARKIAADLKRRYDNTCMFCGSKLEIYSGRFYAEAAHIRPLGKPHFGPDQPSNMVVLCPNHHLQFDNGALRIQVSGSEYRVKSTVPSHALDGKLIIVKHRIDREQLLYHWNRFESAD